MNIIPREEPRIPTMQAVEESDQYHLSNMTYRRVRETFGEKLPTLRTAGVIIDVGCSRGDTTRELADIYPESFVVGVDINPQAVDIANDTHQQSSLLPFRRADGYRLNEFFRENSADAIFLMNNLYQAMKKLTDERVKKILENIISVIGETGYLLIAAGSDFYVFKILKAKAYLESMAPEVHATVFGYNPSHRSRLLSILEIDFQQVEKAMS